MSTNSQLDGASNVDTGNNGGTHVTINPDAIEEVQGFDLELPG